MEKTKSVQSLKRQLTAAIAMVLVAAIALVSATYAWFVANNTVTATTSTISAQSNAPFLKIDDNTGIDDDSTTAKSLTDEKTPLYPAQVVGKYDAADTDNGIKADEAKFESAYASTKTAATELTDSRFVVGNAAKAVTGEYAIEQVFTIGTTDDKAGSFKNLKVAHVIVNGTSKLKDAMRVLVVGDDGWAVYKCDSNINEGTGVGTLEHVTTYKNTTNDSNQIAGQNEVLDTEIAGGTDSAATVKVYVFYDGAETDIHTENLNKDQLKDCGVTVTFTATPVSPDGNETQGSNAVSGNNK